MHHNFINKIGSASYLNKSNGLYIPFEIKMQGTNCALIKPSLEKNKDLITYIDKDNNR